MSDKMPDWQSRVLQERNELGKKITALVKFLELRHADQGEPVKLLRYQLSCMQEYYGILSNRIVLF